MKKLLWVVFAAILAVPGMATAQSDWDTSFSVYGGSNSQMVGVGFGGWNTATRSSIGGFDFGGMVSVEQRSTGQMTHASAIGGQELSVNTDPSAAPDTTTATTASLLVRRPFGKIGSRTPRGTWYPYMGLGGLGGAYRQAIAGVGFAVDNADLILEYRKGSSDISATTTAGLVYHF